MTHTTRCTECGEITWFEPEEALEDDVKCIHCSSELDSYALRKFLDDKDWNLEKRM